MNDNERAYAAGLLDGEGSIGVYAHRVGKYQTAVLKVTIRNTFLPVLVWMQERWGGYVSPPDRTNDRCKWRFNWSVDSARAAAFLAEVRPFIIIKRAQLENGLAFQATKRTTRKKLTADEWAGVETFMRTSRDLNKLGPS